MCGRCVFRIVSFVCFAHFPSPWSGPPPLLPRSRLSPREKPTLAHRSDSTIGHARVWTADGSDAAAPSQKARRAEAECRRSRGDAATPAQPSPARPLQRHARCIVRAQDTRGKCVSCAAGVRACVHAAVVVARVRRLVGRAWRSRPVASLRSLPAIPPLPPRSLYPLSLCLCIAAARQRAFDAPHSIRSTAVRSRHIAPRCLRRLCPIRSPCPLRLGVCSSPFPSRDGHLSFLRQGRQL